MSSCPKCHFNYNTLEAKVGNKIKGYETLNCLPVPIFKRIIKERESLGNGWYGSNKVDVEYEYKCFIIMKNNKPFGILINPYHEESIKNDIISIDSKTCIEIDNFIKTLTNENTNNNTILYNNNSHISS